MSTPVFITDPDITDNVIKKFQLTDYIAETNNEIWDVAEKKGVRDATDLELSPVHHKIKRCAVAYLCMRVSEDFMGTNNNDIPEMEKYAIKYKVYHDRYIELRGEISRSMFTGDVDEVRDRANLRTGIIFRS